MSIAGAPLGRGDHEHDDGRATPSGEPPLDWNAQFTAIVSGISGSMHWEATPQELDGAPDQMPTNPADLEKAMADFELPPELRKMFGQGGPGRN